jgi:hypothetical protein
MLTKSVESPSSMYKMGNSHESLSFASKRNGESMDPDILMDGLSKELNVALKAMAKSKDIDEKEAHSRIIKNLCESLGVFLNLASEMMQYDDDFEDDDNPF